MSSSDTEFELWSEIRDIYRAALKKLNARLAEKNMTFPQYNVLLALGRNGPMKMSTLGDHMLVAPANVTGLIDRIEAKGYVRRVRDPDDRRLWVIELTDEGSQLFREVSTRFRKYVRGLGSSLSPRELASAVASLDKVRKRVREPAGL